MTRERDGSGLDEDQDVLVDAESGAAAAPTAAHPNPRSGAARARSMLGPVRRVSSAVVNWVKGPDPPQIQRVDPLFPRAQLWPIQTLDRYLPKRRQKLALLLAFYFCWLLAFVVLLHHSAFAGELDGYGKPARISCLASYWGAGNGCGLNGNDCRPFEDEGVAFRCPANCASVRLLNPHAVGAQELIYRPLVVGGPAAAGSPLTADHAYRADSFVCAAAIHAGVVSDRAGGCGVVRLVGRRERYVGTSRNGIASVGFDSSFPRSFAFAPEIVSACQDLRWPLLAVSVFFTGLISLLTLSPAVFVGSIFVGVYFHVGLASDPPNLSDYYAIISILLGRFLPAAFVAFVMYRYCIRRTLQGLRAPVEKTVLWVGACWVGALTNYTFRFIPISRLTPHDLKQQPGAMVALAIIVAALLIIALGQIWFLRLEGRLPRYLALYITFCVCLGLFIALPGLNLRIHHYILALLLLPGTAMQTRPSLLYQGLLLGLFINGVARWGFDSILQTPAALLGDGHLNSPLPAIATPNITASRITFSWDFPVTAFNENGTFDGISILVNDVERYRGYQDQDAFRFTWTREPTSEPLPYYFRFAYMQGSGRGDYTRAGTWEVDGSWTEMLPGPSR